MNKNNFESELNAKLYEGLIIKNYKVLCKEYLGVKPSAGNTKKSQLKDLECYCEYHKQGNKFVIDKIFENPKEKEDLRKFNGGDHNNNHFKNYYQFKVSKSEWYNIGIYYITNGKDIYIGSTIAGFRERFQQHYYGTFEYMKHTYDLLQNNGEFHILYDMTNIKDIELVRMVENEYIQYFKEYTDFNVINHMNEATWKGKNYKQKYKNIKIKIEDYDNVLKLLEENGIKI